MHRRFRISILALVIVLFAAASALPLASASSSAASVRCGSRSGHTIAADTVARVYAVGDSVYGCAAGGTRSYKLGRRSSCVIGSRVSAFRIAGRLAAYALDECGIDTRLAEVVVRRLTDGAQLHSYAATGPPGPESFQSVDSLVLKADGAVAWIGTAHSIVGNRTLVEVRKADRAGGVRLDSGSAVATRSLRLRRSALSWKHGSATRTASLH